MKTEKKCKLLIYSAQKITDRVKKQITIENVSDFMGGVECEQLKHILNRSTILVHVESFDKKTFMTPSYHCPQKFLNIYLLESPF